MWQGLHAELEQAGLAVVTVALDINASDAEPFIRKAEPTHPSLIDAQHITDELFGFRNVPSAVWIDESGMIVRPAEYASIAPRMELGELPDGTPERLVRTFAEVDKIPGDPDSYRAAILDWVEQGGESRHALDPEQVVAGSAERPPEHAEAAACFELGRWHWARGDHDAAVPWWRKAHELHPENWTYKRQAWTFATTNPGDPPDLLQGPTDLYEGNWLDDLIAAGGGESYYELPDL